MGYRVGLLCHETQPEALAAYYGSSGPWATPGNPSFYSYTTYSAAYSGSQWLLVTKDSNGVDLTVRELEIPNFAACSAGESVTDGVTLGFSVLLVWAVVWGLMQMRRGI